MNENMSYQPSKEEIKLAEGSMTNAQKNMSKNREEDYNAAKGICEIAEMTGEEISFEEVLEEKSTARENREEKTRSELLDKIANTRYQEAHGSWPASSVAYQMKRIFEVSEFAKNDKEVVIAGIKRAGGATEDILELIDRDFIHDREIAMEAVRQDGTAIRGLGEEFKKDEEVALAAVLQNGEAIRYLDKELAGQKNIVLTAMHTYPKAACCSNEELKKDKEFVLSVMNKDNSLFLFKTLDESLLLDPEVQEKAVLLCGNNLYNVPEEYRTKNLIKLAFEVGEYDHDYDFVKLVPEDLRNDSEFMMDLIRIVSAREKYCGGLIDLAGDEIWSKKDWVLELIRYSKGWGFGYRTNAYQKEPARYETLPDELKDDEEIMMAAIEEEGLNLKIAKPEMKESKEVVKIAALNTHGEALEYASEELRGDKDFILRLLGEGDWMVKVYDQLMPDLKNDIDVVAAAIEIQSDRSYDCDFLKKVPKKLLTDKKVLAAAIKKYGIYLTYSDSPLPKELKGKIESYLRRPKEN